jgi:nucleoside-diphosphate-sugar epimerase
VSLNSDTDKVIAWVIAATTHLLKAAASQPSVKSIVLTSSSTAALVPKPNEEIFVDESALSGPKAPNRYLITLLWQIHGMMRLLRLPEQRHASGGAVIVCLCCFEDAAGTRVLRMNKGK